MAPPRTSAQHTPCRDPAHHENAPSSVIRNPCALSTVHGNALQRPLGGGRLGVVYEVVALGLNRTVALKLLREELLARPDPRSRFRDEAEAVARMSHPNGVQIYAVGVCGGRPFLAMEFVPGGSLADRTAACTMVTPRRSCTTTSHMSPSRLDEGNDPTTGGAHFTGALLAAAVDYKWTAGRFLLEPPAPEPAPERVPGHVSVPQPAGVHSTDERRPAPVPPATDLSAGAPVGPNVRRGWWPAILVESEPPAPPSPIENPPAPVTLEPQQPSPHTTPEPATDEPAAALEGAGIIARFLPFDTADLRDEVNGFLTGLEPAIPLVPDQLFDEWETGAAVLAGAGAVLVVGKWRVRTRRNRL
ncbi:MAG TPA: protein kinase [Gemmata sp.]